VTGVQTCALPISETVACPVSALKIVGIDYTVNGQTKSMARFNFTDRNRIKSNSSFWGSGRARFCLQGNSIRFMPVPTGAVVGTLYYVPTIPLLTLTGTLDAPISQWDDYLLNDAAAVCVAKEQGDPGYWKNAADAALASIIAQVPNRVTSEPETVTDIYQTNREYWDDY
jgi:hypothetical protein